MKKRCVFNAIFIDPAKAFGIMVLVLMASPQTVNSPLLFSNYLPDCLLKSDFPLLWVIIHQPPKSHWERPRRPFLLPPNRGPFFDDSVLQKTSLLPPRRVSYVYNIQIMISQIIIIINQSSSWNNFKASASIRWLG